MLQLIKLELFKSFCSCWPILVATDMNSHLGNSELHIMYIERIFMRCSAGQEFEAFIHKQTHTFINRLVVSENAIVRDLHGNIVARDSM